MSRRDRPSSIAQNAADRDAIRAADPIRFLIDALQGKPAAVRDEAGRIVAWSDAPDLAQRISIAQALANKVLPNLQATQLDVSNSDGSLRIVWGGDIPPPASVEDKSEAIDITPSETLTATPSQAPHSDEGDS